MFLLAVGGCGGARTDGARHRDQFWGKALAVDALVREGHTALLAQTTQTKCLFFSFSYLDAMLGSKNVSSFPRTTSGKSHDRVCLSGIRAQNAPCAFVNKSPRVSVELPPFQQGQGYVIVLHFFKNTHTHSHQTR